MATYSRDSIRSASESSLFFRLDDRNRELIGDCLCHYFPANILADMII